MVKFPSLACAVAAAILAMPAQARGLTFDCDTSARHSSQITMPTPGSFLATGRVRIVSRAPGDNVVPLARILVTDEPQNGAAQDQTWAGFSFTTVPGAAGAQPTNVLVADSRAKGAQAIRQTIAAASAADVPFSLLYDAGRVSMNLDGHSLAAYFTAQQPSLFLACTNGSFLFHDVSLVVKP
jgi:hypothetical protein